MEGKVCFVTGATSGIGLETARALARQGATVVLSGRDKGGASRVVNVSSEAHRVGSLRFLDDLQEEHRVHGSPHMSELRAPQDHLP